MDELTSTELCMSAIRDCTQPPPSAIQDIREQYLEVSHSPSRFRSWMDEQQAVMLSILGEDAMAVSTTLTPMAGTELNSPGKYIVIEEEKLISIGRSSLCTIRVGSKGCQMSRIHVLMAKMRRGSKEMFVIMDFWSMLGTQVGTQSSVPGNRTIIYQDVTEPCILILGNVHRIQVNTPMCLVCMQDPRRVVFDPCKHFVSCHRCATKLSSCPICLRMHQHTHEAHEEQFDTYDALL
jgi:hypothetical protein